MSVAGILLVVVEESLPSRERGLKFRPFRRIALAGDVAPFTGAWIEIAIGPGRPARRWSLPSRERGLKCPEPAFP